MEADWVSIEETRKKPIGQRYDDYAINGTLEGKYKPVEQLSNGC